MHVEISRRINRGLPLLIRELGSGRLMCKTLLLRSYLQLKKQM